MTTKRKMIMGIDPGETGGYAGNSIDGMTFGFLVSPVEFLYKIRGLIEYYDIEVYIEKQWSRPKQDVTTMDKLMCNFCMIKGILVTLGIPYTEVAPQTWKSSLFGTVEVSKKDAVEYVKERYDIKLKLTEDGIADAFCLMHYGMLEVNLV